MAINQIFSLRGATTIDNNTSIEIINSSVELMQALILANDLVNKDFEIVSIIASTTTDVTAFYPVRAIRESNLAPNVPLFSCIEPSIENSLPLAIRFLLQVTSKSDTIVLPKHVYLKGAKNLRQDLSNHD